MTQGQVQTVLTTISKARTRIIPILLTHDEEQVLDIIKLVQACGYVCLRATWDLCLSLRYADHTPPDKPVVLVTTEFVTFSNLLKTNKNVRFFRMRS
jgi:hypothetical protein